MLRRAAVGSAIIGAGGAGWALGSVRSARTELALEQAQLRDHPWVQRYRARLRKEGFQDVTEARRLILSRFQAAHAAHMFSTTILKGPNRLNPEGPLTLKNLETGEVVEVFHVGAELRQQQYFYSACATMFDECLAFTAFPRLPNKVGVTASLDIAQLTPLPYPEPSDAEGGGLIVLRAAPTAASGRKCGASGDMYVLSKHGPATHIARSQALFVEPWWGKYIARLL